VISQLVAGKLADGGPKVEMSIVEDADACAMQAGMLFLCGQQKILG
jgi:hypothetical protein